MNGIILGKSDSLSHVGVARERIKAEDSFVMGALSALHMREMAGTSPWAVQDLKPSSRRAASDLQIETITNICIIIGILIEARLGLCADGHLSVNVNGSNIKWEKRKGLGTRH